MTSTPPVAGLDVDLADGRFYADGPAAREAYKWMRAHQPVFRDRNGLAAATSHQAVLDAERNLFAAEQTLIELRRAQVDNLVTLYVALGGGLVERAGSAAR